MKSFHTPTYTQFNTLSVPIATIDTVSVTGLLAMVLFLYVGSAPVFAGTQHYEAPLDSVQWEASSKELHCSLTHDIPLYGQAKFAQSAGEELTFTLRVKNKATRKKDIARLRSMPPEWKHQISVVDLGDIPVIKGNTPFKIEGGIPGRMLAELQKGMFPTFSYRDWTDARDQVTVALPGVNIKESLDEFISCLGKLPIYKFADFKTNLLHFAFGKHSLTKKDRKRLDAVAKYIKSDPSVKRVEIYGHTDNVGRKRNNDKLGKRRSASVKKYLVSKGVSADIFKLISHGERKPKVSNRSDKGRATNRRASVVLIRK